MLDRARPELFVPWIDDGGRRDDLGGRLIAENARAGHPVGGEEPSLPGGDTAPLGLGYLLGAPTGVPAATPPRYEGDLGGRIARRTALLRAEWELAHGRRAEAARAAGVWERLDAETQAGLAAEPRPPLAPLVPRVTPVFVSAPWQEDLFIDDLEHMARRTPSEAPTEPFERRIHHAWRLLLAGDPGGQALLEGLGAEARVATANMLERFGRVRDAAGQLETVIAREPGHEGALVLLGMLLANEGKLAEAEGRLRSATEAHPNSPRPWATLGVVLAKQGRMADASAAWDRSLALDPSQGDVRAWRASLAP
jgi:predicted Zn-dependent protease